ncbi:hypothetical protein BAU08_01290 [Bordetella bronchialis]|uniref:Uncharacterized protein n=1 Tax=Bordetella bronchialis TaxID=463025 RepID=A0A193FSJ4_9BORD|nr:hypothetical protein BAU06_01295 [Bordetella bronchialis]ANN70161.1 hypothetical protein BAU08_01290 [Bordetella bronchialis]
MIGIAISAEPAIIPHPMHAKSRSHFLAAQGGQEVAGMQRLSSAPDISTKRKKPTRPSARN